MTRKEAFLDAGQVARMPWRATAAIRKRAGYTPSEKNGRAARFPASEAPDWAKRAKAPVWRKKMEEATYDGGKNYRNGNG